VSVIEPAGQSAQATVELALYCPAEHCVQAVAAIALKVVVAEPAAQTAHATVDALLNCPAGQAVHVVAAMALKVSVTEPASQPMQLTEPKEVLYWPEEQPTQATVESVVYCPAVQAVHELAPG
jgi:hypothetical protein